MFRLTQYHLLALLGLLAGRPLFVPHPAPQSTAQEGAQASDPQQESPFTTDEALEALLKGEPTDENDFAPLEQRPTLPDMRLRGFIKMKKKEKPAALVELVGIGTYTTREKERLSFTLRGVRRPVFPQQRPEQDGTDNAPPARSVSPAAGAIGPDLPIVLRVEHVGRDGVIVEVGSLGQYFVIR